MKIVDTLKLFYIFVGCFQLSSASEISDGTDQDGSKVSITIKEKIPKNHTYAFETMLIRKELERASDMFASVKKRGYSIYGFYHTSTWREHWKFVITEQLKLLDGYRKRPPQNTTISENITKIDDYEWIINEGSKTGRFTSLLENSEELYLNVAGSVRQNFEDVQKLIETLDLKFKSKIKTHYSQTVNRWTFHGAKPEQRAALMNSTTLTEGEVSTVNAMHDFCVKQKKQGKKSLVYYIHSKGSCCIRPSPSTYITSVASWRELMNTFIIEFPSICLRALMRGYSACGVDNQDAHYSGNFWWSDCDHVAALPRLWNPFDAYAVEYFVFNVSDWHISRKFGFHCGYSAHTCPLNHYDFECPRADYMDKLQKMVSRYRLPPSSVAKQQDKGNSTKICRDLKKKPYLQQKQDIYKYFG